MRRALVAALMLLAFLLPGAVPAAQAGGQAQTIPVGTFAAEHQRSFRNAG